MTTRFYVRMARLVLAVGVVALVGNQSAYAAADPTTFEYKCLSDKQKEGAKYCKSVLKAWSKWDKLLDDAKRDEALVKALDKLTPKWAKAEEKALLKGVDCTISTETAAGMATLIDDGVATIVAEVNDGLDLSGTNKDDQKCGQKLLNAAATKCLKMLLAESKYLKKPDKDPAGAKRVESQAKASTKFSEDWAKFSTDCPTNATEGEIEGLVDALSDAVVLGTVVSPAVSDDQFDTISPTGTTSYQDKDLTPTCIYNTPYHFFAKRGSVNKLLMYYQGGGACWEQLTCGIPVCDSEVNPAGGDNPNNSFYTGFADLTNPDNPFRDWNIVFVSYCTCDVHFGDAEQYYDNATPGSPLHVWHRGFHNAKIAEKFAREHFVNPEEVFVTGSSAGAYGAIFQAPLLHAAWPYSKFSVLGDAGNGVITESFLQNEFDNWLFTANLPEYLDEDAIITDGGGIPEFMREVADYFPATNWAHYTAAFDGGSGGQTGFYNVMLHDNDPGYALNWWKASCAWNGVMRQQAADTYAEVAAANDNYRYYIATGSRHTMWGTDRVYTDTTGGVPLLVDWVNDMRTGGPGWVNVQADPYNVLFPGACVGGDTPGAPCGCSTDCPGGGTCSGADVRPCPLKAPFELSGDDTIVNCPSPSGAFLDVGESVLD